MGKYSLIFTIWAGARATSAGEQGAHHGVLLRPPCFGEGAQEEVRRARVRVPEGDILSTGSRKDILSTGSSSGKRFSECGGRNHYEPLMFEGFEGSLD